MRWWPLLLLGACDGATATYDWPAPNGVLPADDDAVAAQAALGRLLFYDPILSADGETACATCHSEIWGMSDGLPRSIGLGGGLLAGPGRQGPNVLTRNAPTLWNVAFRDALMWDGREPSLEAQVLMPMHAADELALAPDEVVRRLAAVPEYAARFVDVFGEPVALSHVQTAIAAFERTLISDDSLWDAWQGGDDAAMTAQMKRGARVFADSGCEACHVPPLFESDVYAQRVATADPGRTLVTHDEADRGAMRTPSLRNARETGPYFHDGSVATLAEAIRHELDHDGVAPSADDEAALLAFIGRALVDRSRDPDRPDVVPSGLPVPEDGFRIVRP